MNIKEIINLAVSELNYANIPSAHIDAEVLLLKALANKNVNKSWLYMNTDYLLTKKEEREFLNLIDRRKRYEPTAYLINNKEFYGYDFYVDKNVLIPRPETETIVQETLDTINKYKKKKNIDLVDIGTGSGCIMISILNELIREKKIDLIKNAIANDVSKNAIKIAKMNAKRFKLDKKIKFIISDLEKAVDYTKFHFSKNLIITANLPYIKTEDYNMLSANVKKYEPKTALLGGNDGLTYIKKLIKMISAIQNNSNINISVFIEIDPAQTTELNQIVRRDLRSMNTGIILDLSQKKRFLKLLTKASGQKN